ncbi:hypothetical protein EXIGLDRAFT_734852 [Exidia glandulosa HHB12029]|uniref:Uncharacterized protein n=1 Tax=Exidia glandulosa HHB12029 TaxID=1314781 RepID=A0A165AZ80_EXIGL|nr:hypothetical protein EXIGLDRAFT_734852 [Exidia glandulosa HHB12029]
MEIRELHRLVAIEDYLVRRGLFLETELRASLSCVIVVPHYAAVGAIISRESDRLGASVNHLTHVGTDPLPPALRLQLRLGYVACIEDNSTSSTQLRGRYWDTRAVVHFSSTWN